MHQSVFARRELTQDRKIYRSSLVFTHRVKYRKVQEICLHCRSGSQGRPAAHRKVQGQSASGGQGIHDGKLQGLRPKAQGPVLEARTRAQPESSGKGNQHGEATAGQSAEILPSVPRLYRPQSAS